MHSYNHKFGRKELVFFDVTNPRSIICVVPEAFKSQLKLLWDSEINGRLLGLNESDLITEFNRKNRRPNASDHKLRFNFWMEYDRVMADERAVPINMQSVIGTVISKEAFYKFYITDPLNLAWLMCPPTNYIDKIEEVLNYSLTKLQEAMSLPVATEAGTPNLNFLKFVSSESKEMYRRLRELKKIPAFLDEPEVIKPKIENLSEPSVQDKLAAARARIAAMKQQKENDNPIPKPDPIISKPQIPVPTQNIVSAIEVNSKIPKEPKF